MSTYERPAILLVGSEGKPSHLGAIIRFKALDIAKLTGKSVRQLMNDYEAGKGELSIKFNIVDIVEAGTEKAKKAAAQKRQE
ncbi:MAG: hypothetical protein EHM23_12370 [Acidobacteria bacterium]|nr:MAG: hypothetical protein EHM23_12370 [Acidobacteriota bacterium]